MEATMTKKRHTTHPMSYQTKIVFDMPLEEDFPDMDKEIYTAEEAYEQTMKDIKAIYEENDAV